jgi:hypothetical protein
MQIIVEVKIRTHSTMIQTLLDLVVKGHFHTVELKFQVKEHTRNSVDRGFGYTKRAFLSNYVYTIECFANVVQNAASDYRSNSNKCIPIIVDGPVIFRKYTEYYHAYYKKTENVQNCLVFKATNADLESIYCMSPTDPST